MHTPSCVLRCAYAKAQESGREGKRSYTTRHATTSFKQEERECTHAGTNSRSAERVLRMLMMLLSSSLPPSLLYPILSYPLVAVRVLAQRQFKQQTTRRHCNELLQRQTPATRPGDMVIIIITTTTKRYPRCPEDSKKQKGREREREPITRRDHG